MRSNTKQVARWNAQVGNAAPRWAFLLFWAARRVNQAEEQAEEQAEKQTEEQTEQEAWARGTTGNQPG